MGAISTAIKADKAHGPTLDRFRGIVPRALLLYWISEETGWDRMSVSTDRKLIEVGWSQAPLARAWKLNADPFDTIGALWIAGVEALGDVAYWRADGTDDPMRRKIGEWLTKADANLWWTIQADYSVGTGALRHILSCAIARAEGRGRGPSDLGLLIEVIDWAAVTDLSLPIHARHWGRQSPEQIAMRIKKHRDWIVNARKVGPINDAPSGEPAPLVRPVDALPFPRELIPWVKVAARKDTSADEQLRAWTAVREYARARARRENTKRPSLVFTAKRWLARNELHEPVEREA